MAVCAGCTQVIEKKDISINCCKCNFSYDILCSGLTIEKYSKLTNDAKRSWSCISCRSKVPKISNLDTPVRLLMGVTEADTCGSDSVSEGIENNSSFDFENITLRRRQKTNGGCHCICSDPNILRSMIREELRAVLLETFSEIPKLPMVIENMTHCINKVEKVHLSVLNQLKEKQLASTPSKNDMSLKSPAPLVQSVRQSSDAAFPKPSSSNEPKTTTTKAATGRLAKDKPEVALAVQPEVSINNEEPGKNEGPPAERFDHSGEVGEIREDSHGWKQVEHRRDRTSQSKVLHGTACPGVTLLHAAERKAFLHLFYVKEGTTEDQVRAHLQTVCGEDVSTVEALRSRGSYASFKIGVPCRLADLVMLPNNWAEGICIKAWRQNFRSKRVEKKCT